MYGDVESLNKQIKELEKQKRKIIEEEKRKKYSTKETHRIIIVMKDILANVNRDICVDELEDLRDSLETLFYEAHPKIEKWEFNGWIDDYIRREKECFEEKKLVMKAFIQGLEKIKTKMKW